MDRSGTSSKTRSRPATCSRARPPPSCRSSARGGSGAARRCGRRARVYRPGPDRHPRAGRAVSRDAAALGAGGRCGRGCRGGRGCGARRSRLLPDSWQRAHKAGRARRSAGLPTSSPGSSRPPPSGRGSYSADRLRGSELTARVPPRPAPPSFQCLCSRPVRDEVGVRFMGHASSRDRTSRPGRRAARAAKTSRPVRTPRAGPRGA